MATKDFKMPEIEQGNVQLGQALIEGNTFIVRPVTFEIINGMAIFEGDIILGTVTELEEQTRRLTSLFPTGMERLAVVITGNRFRWLDCLVPYDFDPNLPTATRDTVIDAIEHWQDQTPMRFILRTPGNRQLYPDWVRFQPGNECSSPVGRKGDMQLITLAPDCGFGGAVHEIGHAVGLWHEQSREDRDQFVEILIENIEPKKRHNFDQNITDGDDVGPYDYQSIMHYGRDYFSVNGQDTIRPRMQGVEIGQRDGLSRGDVNAVQTMYRRQFTREVNDRWVASYRFEQTERMYAFIQHDQQLAIRYWDGVDEWKWASQGSPDPALAIASDPDVLSSWQFYGREMRQLHAFVIGGDRSLYERGWSDSMIHPQGQGWYWSRLGTPSGKSLQGALPGAISFRAESRGELFDVADRIEIFIPDDEGGFHRCSWNGINRRWTWHDQSPTRLVNPTLRPRAIAFWYRDHKRIYSFIPSSGGGLLVNFSSNSFLDATWEWADLGTPGNGEQIASSVTAVSYRYNNTDRIYTFMTTRDGNLYTCFWTGSVWEWANLGAPRSSTVGTIPSGVLLAGTPASTVFSYLDKSQLHLFVRGSDGGLYHDFWDGSDWQWEPLGHPAEGVNVSGEPAVLPYTHRHLDRLYVFCRGTDGNLHICYLDDREEWVWTNQGIP